MSNLPRVYLAGPDLFYPDAEERYGRLRAACKSAGMIGIAPNDGLILPVPASGKETAQRIYHHDMHMLTSCDLVLANLSPFRGPEPDSGTVFECAYTFAQGIPVAGYSVDGLTTAGRHPLLRKVDFSSDGALLDREDGGTVENFDLPANLMLACSFPIVQTPQQALEKLAEMISELSHNKEPQS
jgi:nucleoside 2-deoxyribosyltransferase